MTLISTITTNEERDHAHEESTLATSGKNCLHPLGLNVTEAAEVLGVACHTLSRVLNGHAGTSPAMGIGLEKAGWSSVEFWLSRQSAYDLAEARRGEDRMRVEHYQPMPIA